MTNSPLSPVDPVDPVDFDAKVVAVDNLMCAAIVLKTRLNEFPDDAMTRNAISTVLDLLHDTWETIHPSLI